ncbi:hypothetical protein QUF54_05055, partial [Candidatus Marithioploca araucensis]|nr:hypothetical protein [Candidatus Marithioploca araucensis]
LSIRRQRQMFIRDGYYISPCLLFQQKVIRTLLKSPNFFSYPHFQWLFQFITPSLSYPFVLFNLNQQSRNLSARL